MGTTARQVRLNLFEVEFSAARVNLPSKRFQDNQVATAFLREQPRSVRAHRSRMSDGTTSLYVFDGPVASGQFETVTVDLSTDPNMAVRLAKHAMQRYFRDRGYIARDERFNLLVRERDPRLKRGAAVVYQGVSLQITCPFAERAPRLAAIATWQTPAEFTASITDPVLRGMALGHDVIYRPIGDTTEELRKFRNRYLGRVREFTSDTEAAVYCSDHAVRLLPTSDLYLEARPNVLAEYDRRIGTVGSEPVWSQMLKMNHTLSEGGRRNTAVLHDRLVSITEFLGGGKKQRLSLPTTKFDDVVLNMSLEPLSVSVTPRV